MYLKSIAQRTGLQIPTNRIIGKDIRLDPVLLKEANIKSLLEYFMGKNTPDRQQHIIQNLRVEVDILEEVAVA